jgi:hypothetical protein
MEWSEIERCPDCGETTLRVFWGPDVGTPQRVDEFCDNPACPRGDVVQAQQLV